MNILNVGYDSANYYLLEPDSVGLLVDVGWPGTLPKLQAACRRMGVPFQKIRYLLATHYHPDHAGLAQELKELGIKLIVVDVQLPLIPELRRVMKPENHYHEIRLDDNLVLTVTGSREFLASIGVRGELLHTPGHSPDSVTLLLDEGVAFTGDLTPPALAWGEQRDEVESSWAKIRAHGVKTIYAGHG